MRGDVDTEGIVDSFLDLIEFRCTGVRTGAIYLRQVLVIDLQAEIMILAQVNSIVQVNRAGHAGVGCLCTMIGKWQQSQQVWCRVPIDFLYLQQAGRSDRWGG